jgi:hypothetical protein
MALVFVSRPAWRGIAAVVAGSYGWIIAAQVELAGWHKPSDAIGAAFVAFGSVTAIAGVMAWVRPVDRDRRGSPKWAFGVLGTVAVAAAIGTGWGLVRVLGYLRHHSRATESAAMQHAAFLTALAMTVAVVVLLLLVLTALLGRWDFDGGTARQVTLKADESRGASTATSYGKNGGDPTPRQLTAQSERARFVQRHQGTPLRSAITVTGSSSSPRWWWR